MGAGVAGEELGGGRRVWGARERSGGGRGSVMGMVAGGGRA